MISNKVNSSVKPFLIALVFLSPILVQPLIFDRIHADGIRVMFTSITVLCFILLRLLNFAKLSSWLPSNLFLLLACLGLLHGWATDASDLQFSRYLEYLLCLVVASFIYVSLSEKDPLRTYAWVCVWLALLSALCHLVLILSVDVWAWNWTREPLPFNNIRISGFLGYFGFCSSLVLIYFVNSPRQQWLLLMPFMLISTWLIWMGGRGSIYPSLMFFAGFLIVSLKKFNVGFALSLIALFILSINIANQYAFDPGLGLSWGHGADRDTLESFSSGRVKIWIHSLTELIDTAPWLGWGADGYKWSATQGSIATATAQPHSFIVQLVTDFGLPIAVSIICVLVFCWQRSCARILKNFMVEHFLAFWMLTCSGLMILVDGVFYYYYSFILSSVLMMLVFNWNPSSPCMGIINLPQRLARYLLLLVVGFYTVTFSVFAHWVLFT